MGNTEVKQTQHKAWKYFQKLKKQIRMLQDLRNSELSMSIKGILTWNKANKKAIESYEQKLSRNA